MSTRAIPETAVTPWRGPGQLALALQEVLTATVRLRAGRQAAPDARALREQIRHLLEVAERDALQAGYAPEQVRLAKYAVTALFDEAVLNHGDPAMAEWAQRPLQDELFGGHVGGEHFFRQLRQLLAAPDTTALADLLEVYHLCLLLGFRGRYGVADGGELPALRAALDEKVRRIRGAAGELSPDWHLPRDEQPAPRRDPWVRRLFLGAAAVAASVTLLYAGYRSALASQGAAVRTEAARADEAHARARRTQIADTRDGERQVAPPRVAPPQDAQARR